MQHCFPPVTREDTRILLLGSLPGAMSLAAQRYYANPRNQFWRLTGAAIGRDLEALPASLPVLRAVGFNGGKSASIGRRQLARRAGLALIDLPSSSPAFTLAFEAKRERWLELRPFLGDR